MFSRQRYLRVDNRAAIFYAVTGVGGLSLIGAALIHAGLIKSFYSSPYVLICAVIANRVCIRSGIAAAVLSILVHEYVFAAPYWEINIPTHEQALAYVSCFAAAWCVARRRPEAPPAVPPAPPTAMPFMVKPTTDTATKWWSVEPTNDWNEDADVGAEYARIYLEAAKRSLIPPLGWIVRDMIRTGRWSGIEAGFCNTVGASALGHRPVGVGHNHPPEDADIGGPVVKS